MSTSHTDRSEALRQAAAAAAADRNELRRNSEAAKRKAQQRARSGGSGPATAAPRSQHVTRGALTRGTGGATIGYAMVKGSYRALRHAPGVAGLLWQLGTDIAADATGHIEEPSTNAEDFEVDGHRARDGNRRGSYRVSVRTHTRKAVYHQHDDHILEAAVAAKKARGI